MPLAKLVKFMGCVFVLTTSDNKICPVILRNSTLLKSLSLLITIKALVGFGSKVKALFIYN